MLQILPTIQQPSVPASRTLKDVEQLLVELHRIARKNNIPRIDEISDSIECLTRSYALSSIESSVSDAFCDEQRFTVKERRVFQILYRFLDRSITKDAVYNACYFDASPDDMPETKILDIFVCRMRKKLVETRFTIETVWGVGWRLIEKAS